MQSSATSPLPKMICERMPILRRNDRQTTPNDAIKTLQRRLNEVNIRLTVDGFFGPKTEAAVRQFQERGNDHDPSVIVDGIVGSQTWETLGLCTRMPKK